ncbi:hypothetical protein OROMI_021162 [Orobanche minor]
MGPPGTMLVYGKNTSTNDANTSTNDAKTSIIEKLLLTVGTSALLFLLIRELSDYFIHWKGSRKYIIPVIPELKITFLGPCVRFSLSDLETATNGFAKDNLIGKGLHGTVYKGYLEDGSAVAVKNLTGTREQAKKIFKVEYETLGNASHINLANIIGNCVNDGKRYMVYQYVDNGNLQKWLHGGDSSPLTWDIRMKIAIQIARTLRYLHDGLTRKIVHGNVKSSNILVDKDWNAKLTDFGLAKSLKKHETRYVYDEGWDVYSFGVLLMEIVTGRSPVKMNLVDWFNKNTEEAERLLDPKMSVRPSPTALARVVLVCLECTDKNKHVTMDQAISMLGDD